MSLLSKEVHASGKDGEWLESLIRLFGDHSRTISQNVWSDSLELTRDAWSNDVLGVLRPHGRYIFEITVPLGTSNEEIAARAVAHISEAKRAFEDGRYRDVAKSCYPALEELQKLGDRVETRYGSFGKDRALEQIKALRSFCNPARHASKTDREDVSYDRALGQHVLNSTISLASVFLA